MIIKICLPLGIKLWVFWPLVLQLQCGKQVAMGWYKQWTWGPGTQGPMAVYTRGRVLYIRGGGMQHTVLWYATHSPLVCNTQFSGMQHTVLWYTTHSPPVHSTRFSGIQHTVLWYTAHSPLVYNTYTVLWYTAHCTN